MRDCSAMQTMLQKSCSYIFGKDFMAANATLNRKPCNYSTNAIIAIKTFGEVRDLTSPNWELLAQPVVAFPWKVLGTAVSRELLRGPIRKWKLFTYFCQTELSRMRKTGS